MTRGIVPHHEALQALLYITGWWRGFLPVTLGSWGPREVIWRQGPDGKLAAVVQRLDCEHDDDVILGLPVREPWADGVGVGSVLWARVKGPEQLRRARVFRPLPSLVLAEGSATQRLLFWALESKVPWPRMLEQNRRLAYKFGAVQKHGNPDDLRFNAPGTFMREGRSRPAAVTCARLTTASYSMAAFEKHRALKDPPPPPDFLRGG